MNNSILYTRIFHIYDDKGKLKTLSKFRKDPDIGGYTDIHDISDFYRFICKEPLIVDKKDQLWLWAPCSFIARRRKSDVISVHAMVFDVDCGLPYETHERFKDYNYVAHTSFSHSEGHHKWRLILPLWASIPRDEWKYAWIVGSQIFEKLTGSKIDPSCKDSSRAYFIGGCLDTKMSLYRSNLNITGRNLRLEYDIPPPPKKRHKGKIKTFTQEEFKRYENLKPDDKDRQDIAISVGAEISDNVARKIRCPNCGRRTVYFFINPSGANPLYRAKCNHENSCGFIGSISEL